MKNQWLKKISIILTVLFLLAVLPMSAMAAKGGRTKTATPSNMEEEDYEDEEWADFEDTEPEDDPVLTEAEEVVSEAVEEEAQTKAAEELPETVDAAVPKAGAALKAEDIAGTWKIDSITSYRFNADGTGALVLPEHKYPFDFTLEGDEITLKFDSSKIRDVTFTVTLEGSTLTLTREEAGGTAEFTLEKIGVYI